LVDENGFNRERVVKGIEKLKKSKASATQGRLDSFFGPATTIKRTAPPAKEEAKGSKKAKTDVKSKDAKPKDSKGKDAKGKDSKKKK
jgi:hypothetical protein